jgi:hypothetical protein
MPPPNTRVQRTRSSPSAPHSPLTRQPLGVTSPDDSTPPDRRICRCRSCRALSVDTSGDGADLVVSGPNVALMWRAIRVTVGLFSAVILVGPFVLLVRPMSLVPGLFFVIAFLIEAVTIERRLDLAIFFQLPDTCVFLGAALLLVWVASPHNWSIAPPNVLQVFKCLPNSPPAYCKKAAPVRWHRRARRAYGATDRTTPQASTACRTCDMVCAALPWRRS